MMCSSYVVTECIDILLEQAFCMWMPRSGPT